LTLSARFRDGRSGCERPDAAAAYLDGRIVGLARFVQDNGSPKKRHKGEVDGMYVVLDARGQVIGSALLDALVEYASCVVEQLRLGVVDTNLVAFRLYEKHGFEVYGREVRALKTAERYFDEVLMVRFLAPGFGAPT
jgi:ribosomal protein S18 acetylase RimI-like enzyme